MGLYPGKQAANSKKDAFNAWKVRAGLFPSKVKKGKIHSLYTLLGEFGWDFTQGKQATNSRNATFTAGRVPTGFRSGKQATNSKKALFVTRRVRAGFGLI